jgi:hypothetical protein
MQTASEFRFSRFASAVAIAATLAACGGTDQSPSGSSGCTLALHASTDDAHLQAAIETALRRQDPCSLADPALRTVEARTAGADVRTSYELVRVERDDQSVRAVFAAAPETRSAGAGE